MYLSVFSPNVGRYRTEKTPYLDTFHAVLALLCYYIDFNYAQNRVTRHKLLVFLCLLCFFSLRGNFWLHRKTHLLENLSFSFGAVYIDNNGYMSDFIYHMPQFANAKIVFFDLISLL